MIKLIVAVLMVAGVAGAYLSPSQTRYLSHTRKVVATKVDGTNIISVVRQGLTESVVTQAIRRISGRLPTNKYSRRKLVQGLKSAGKWPLVRSWLAESGWEDEWLVSTYLAADDPLFIAATNAVVAAGVLSASEVSGVLSRSLWDD